MQKIIPFLIYTNIIVSLSALSLYRITEILFQFSNYNLGLFVFFSTLLAYNYMRLPLFSELETKRIKWVQNHITVIYGFILFSLAITVYLIILLGNKFIALISPIIFISIIYPVQINFSSSKYNLRKVPLLKMLLISITWVYVTLIVPLIYNNTQINYYEIDVIFQRFLFLLSICVIFDIKDLKTDNIVTLPRYIGTQKSKYFTIFCLFVIELLLLIDLLNNTVPFNIFLGLILSIEVSAFVLYTANENRGEWFYDVLVESLSIIMCLFVFFTSIFNF